MQTGRTLAVGAAVIGIACGAVTQRHLPPAGSPRDDGTGLLSQASVELALRPIGGATYGGVEYAGARYAAATYGGGRYASYQFHHDRSGRRHGPGDQYLPSYTVNHTLPAGSIAGSVAWRTRHRPAAPGDPTCPAPTSDRPIDAVVSIRGASRGPAFAEARLGHVGSNSLDGLIEIGRCGVSPRVQAIGPMSRLATAVLARDKRARVLGVASETSEVLFELDLRSRGERRLFDLTQPGIVEITATGASPAWIAVIGHPMYATPDPDGSFYIADVPAGEHTLRIWHPPATGTRPIVVDQKIKVQVGKTARVSITLDPAPRSRDAGSAGR